MAFPQKGFDVAQTVRLRCSIALVLVSDKPAAIHSSCSFVAMKTMQTNRLRNRKEREWKFKGKHF
jgi:hypothetical protein